MGAETRRKHRTRAPVPSEAKGVLAPAPSVKLGITTMALPSSVFVRTKLGNFYDSVS